MYFTTGSIRQVGVENDIVVGHESVTSQCSHTPVVSTEYHTVQDAEQTYLNPILQCHKLPLSARSSSDVNS
jgi:hypothetical protein